MRLYYNDSEEVGDTCNLEDNVVIFREDTVGTVAQCFLDSYDIKHDYKSDIGWKEEKRP